MALAPASALAHPGSGIAIDRLGQVYFVDTGSGAWKIDTHGALIQLSNQRFHWMTLDAANRFGRAKMPTGLGWEMVRVGSSPTLLLSSDFPLAMGPDGDLYYPVHGPRDHVDIMRLAVSGHKSVFASVSLPHLGGLAFGPDGSLYYSEIKAIRKISTQGRVSTVAENIPFVGCADIPGTEENDMLRGLTVDASGTVYVASSACGQVLKVTTEGKVSTVFQSTAPWSPTAVVHFGKDLFVLEYLHTAVEDRLQWIPRVRKITADGTSTIIATVSRK